MTVVPGTGLPTGMPAPTSQSSGRISRVVVSMQFSAGP
jgi:hypothetical protein